MTKETAMCPRSDQRPVGESSGLSELAMHLAGGVESDEGLAVGGGRELSSGNVEEAALDGLVGGRLAELDSLAARGLLAESKAGVLGGDVGAGDQRVGGAGSRAGGGGAADVALLRLLSLAVVGSLTVVVVGLAVVVVAGAVVVVLGGSGGRDASAGLVEDHQVRVALGRNLSSRDGVEVAEGSGAGKGKAEDERLAAGVSLAKLLAGVGVGRGRLGARLDISVNGASRRAVAGVGADGEGAGLGSGGEGNNGGDGELHFDC